MNTFDRTVGGIGSLVTGHGDVDQPGAFEFAQKSEPVLKMAGGGYAPQGYEDQFYEDPDIMSVVQPATQTTQPAATAEQVIAAYKSNPLAELNPSQEAINYWMQKGLSSFEDTVKQARAANPELAKQIDAARAKTTTDYTGGMKQATAAPPPYVAPAPAPFAAPAPAPAVSPAPAAQKVAANPYEALIQAQQQDLSKYLNIYNTGEDRVNPFAVEATGGINVGNYTITPIGTFAPKTESDYEGNQYVNPFGGTAVSGYNVSTEAKTDKGIPITVNYVYGTDNKVQEYTINYKTGGDSGVVARFDAAGRLLDQYGYDQSESWRKPVAIGLSVLGSIVGLPGIGEALSAGALSGAAAGALGGAALGGAGAAVMGKEGSDILKSAGKGAVTGGLSQALNDAELLKSIGIDTTLNKATNTLGQNIANVTGLDQAGDAYNAIKDVVTGGSKAVVQQGLASLLTGQKFDPTVAFIGGGASNAINKYLLDNAQFEKLPENLKNAVTGAITAGALGKNPTAAAVNAFVSNLFKDTSAIKRLKEYPGGEKAVWENLSPLVADTGQADIQDYINDLLSTADLSVPEKTQLMNDIETLIIQNSRYKYGDDFVDNLLSDVYKQTSGKIGESVAVTGGKFKKTEDEVIQDLVDKYVGPGQTVDVTGKYLDKGTAEDQTVDVTGRYLDKIDNQTVDVISKYLDKGDQQVTVQDKKIATGPDDITDQKVEVGGSKVLKELDTTGGINIDDLLKNIPGKLVVPDKITPGTTTTKKTTPGTTTTTSDFGFTPTPTAGGKALPYQLANVFYGGALEYGPGAESMASPSDFQGQKRKAQRAMELALDGQGGENEANSAADAILAMAEQDPGATVDELMNIVQGGRYA